MSVYRDRPLTCPHCGHVTVESVALTLDAKRAVAEVQAILDNTFQRFSCPACEQVFRADGPLMFVDFDGQLWIGMFPESWERDWWHHEQESADAFQRNMVENCPPIVREWAPGFTIRTVFGLPALREKLVAWQAGLDDVVVEAYKLVLLRDLGTFELSGQSRPRLIAVEDGHAVFDVPPQEPGKLNQISSARIPLDELHDIVKRPKKWASVSESLSRGPYVDIGRIFIPRPADDSAAADAEPAAGASVEGTAPADPSEP